FATAVPDYDIAVLYDSDSKFALSTQGPLPAPGTLIDADSYRHIVAAFSRGIFDAKRQQRLVRPQHLLPSRGGRLTPAEAAERFPVLVVAAFYTAADADLEFLLAYADEGGHLVLGPRTGYADVEGRPRAERAPALLHDPAGAWYEEVASLPSPLPVDGELGGSATGFVEGLEVVDAEPLATYRHPHLGRWAAATTKPAGAGRITLVGTVPDQVLAAELARWLVAEPIGGWTTDDSVTVSTNTDEDGRRLHTLHNWNWAEASASVSVKVTDLISGETHAPGERLSLGPWDVRILRTDAG
ncbi:MAG TPA: beta-galactosidase trimerization domain-containing protein, partial [Kribbella sp.]